MKPSELKKDKMTTIRVNKEVESLIKAMGHKSVQKFFDAMIDERIKIEATEKKLFEEGEENYIWQYNYSLKKECLCITTIWECEKCGVPATVNCVWITGGANEKMIKQADAIKEKHGLLTELGATEDGDSICEKCYEEHINQGE